MNSPSYIEPESGICLAQYHVKHDDFVKTITDKSSNFDSPEPTWKRLNRLVKNDHKRAQVQWEQRLQYP